jgi:16S rRNA (cytosine1402-N4)-methyltransferase
LVTWALFKAMNDMVETGDDSEVAQTGSHQSVLLREAIDVLEIASDDTVVDATVGGAGHFKVLMGKLSTEGTLIGIDADADAIKRAQAVYEAAEESPRVFFVEDNFRNIESILDAREISHAGKMLFDLGWSGYQLSRGRGFSFQTDEPLLMTYGAPDSVDTAGNPHQTAADVLNTATEETIADMLYELGEEQFSRRIAHAIVEARKHDRILTTFQLVEIIKKGTPSWYHHRRLHPATKTFQALRIYVNDELGALREGLAAAIHRTKPGGRIAVITFHSIEDRIVKHLFRDGATKGQGSLITKKPIVPSAAELSANPRARSAKLRVFQVCNKKSLRNLSTSPAHQTLYV